MGFFRTLLKEIINVGREPIFTPDFSKPEYDNRLEYISQGGTTESWERAKQANNWVFRESEIEIYTRYLKEVKKVSDMYFSLMQKIQKDWSVLYNTKEYSGQRATTFENECLKDIDYYLRMREIDRKYDQSTPTNVPAFTRLAMLYEKQERYEDSVSVCKKAILLDIDERSRLIRMIKKAGRTPTAEEESLLDN